MNVEPMQKNYLNPYTLKRKLNQFLVHKQYMEVRTLFDMVLKHYEGYKTPLRYYTQVKLNEKRLEEIKILKKCIRDTQQNARLLGFKLNKSGLKK